MLPRCGFKPPLLRTHCDSSADALHRTSRCTSSIAVAVPVARDGGFSRQLKAMPGRVALKSAPRKILRCRSWTCAACRTARRSARDGLPQQALNRAIVAASLGYGPSKTRLPNRSPAAAGKLCRGYSNAPCRFQLRYKISADKSSTRLRFAIRKSASEAIEIRELLRYSKLFNALTLQPLSL